MDRLEKYLGGENFENLPNYPLDCPPALQPRKTMVNTLPCSPSNSLCRTHPEVSNLSI